jgi:GNAT superfamily N-acetyltransferase
VATIEYLADHLDFAATLAVWHFEQWGRAGSPGRLEGDSVEQRLRLLREAANRRTIPTAFVAVLDSQLVGSATLGASDMKTRKDLTPWLKDVFVMPEFRRRGIASMLVRRAVQEAAEIGVREMYLFTTGSWREDLYSGLGWKVIDRPLYQDRERVLMSIEPKP